MQVRDIMARNVACCTPDTNLEHVARLMVHRRCGAIPVVSAEECLRPLGIITSQDIVFRAVALGRNPLELTAQDCMTLVVHSVPQEMNVEECWETMNRLRVRRLVVVDASGCCAGIVSRSDVDRHVSAFRQLSHEAPAPR